jgi:hypothetical protein
LRRLATALTVAMAGGAAVAATGEAATLTITAPNACYVAGDQLSATGAGYTANGYVNVSLDGALLGQLQVDAAGNVVVPIRLGGMKGVKPHTLTVADISNAALTASAGFMGTTRRVTVKPKNARPGKKRRLHGYGFLAGPRVYMHVRGPGYKADRKIAKAAAPCGTFATRLRIVPANARSGRYKVQFDHKKRFAKKTKPRVRGTLTVGRTASGAARASAFGGAAQIAWATVAG